MSAVPAAPSLSRDQRLQDAHRGRRRPQSCERNWNQRRSRRAAWQEGSCPIARCHPCNLTFTQPREKIITQNSESIKSRASYSAMNATFPLCSLSLAGRGRRIDFDAAGEGQNSKFPFRLFFVSSLAQRRI